MGMLMLKTRQDSTGRRGQSLVEFALVAPLLLMVVFGTFDLGWAVYAKNTITNSAREGARVGVVVSKSDADIRTQVKHTAAALGLTDAQIVISPAGNASAPYRDHQIALTVTVNYTYTPLTPIIGQILGGGIPLSSSSTMVVE